MQRVLAPAAVGIALLVAGLARPALSQEDVRASARARAAQQELYRLGCYNDAINGAWTSPSRTAAQKFLARVNARLPVDQPDDTLIALLRSTKEFVCMHCPPGEAINGAGDCVPKALVDKTAKSAPMSTGALADSPRSLERPTGEASAAQRDPATAEPSAGATTTGIKYWRSLLRKVDRALGLE
jgi:hypothetical protein